MAATTASADDRSRRSLQPLRRVLPYVLRYPRMVAGAIVSLTVAAATTLTLPLAVRRMIDHGFSNADTTFVANYFSMLLVIAAILALASACRYYFVISARRARRRRPPERCVRACDRAFAGVLRYGAVGRNRLAAFRRHHADKIRRRRHRFGRAAQHHTRARRGRHDGGDQPKALRPGDRGDPAGGAAAGRLRPLGAAEVAPGAGYAGAGDRLCERADFLGAHAAGLHQREAGDRRNSQARSRPPSRRRARR